MTASTSSAEGQAPPSEADTPEPAGLLVGGDRCSNCGTALAVDQRYCVECGARRGKPRFALAAAAVTASTETPPMTRSSGGWSRLSAALAVIAVLLALGVGVLIGNSTQASLKQPVKVQVTGGTLSSSATTGGGSGATTTPASGGSGGSSSKSCAKGTAGCKHGKQTGNFFGG